MELVTFSARTKSQRNYYNDYPEYNSSLSARGWQCPKLLVEHLKPRLRGHETILEVGCGTGLVGLALKKIGWQGTLIGVDIAEDRLKEASARPVYSSCAQMSAYRLGFPRQSFDVVISCAMLGLTGPQSFKAMYSLVKPNGYLACIAGEVKNLRWCRKRFQKVCHHIRRRHRSQIIFRKDLGTGYAKDGYRDEHYVYYLLQRK